MSHKAAEQSRNERRQRAEQAADSPREARLVTQAGFALEEHDYASAREALKNLHAGGPRHIASVRMLLRAERGAYRVLTPEEAVAYVRTTGPLTLHPLCGGCPPELAWRSLDLVARAVLPALG